MSTIILNQTKLGSLTQRESELFTSACPKSREIAEKAYDKLLWGVPMVWQMGIEGPFSLFADREYDNKLVDIDGNEYLDFSMGVYANAIHCHEPYLTPLKAAMDKGLQHQVPTTAALDAAEALSEKLGPFRWNFSLNGTDANRWAIRLARHITGRPKVLIPNYAYHGTVEEVQLVKNASGEINYYSSDVGTPPAKAGDRTRIVEYNDIDALEAELRHGDTAVMLMEPAMTNIGLVMPEPGYLEAVRELTQKYGTLWLIDETHTMWSGPAGLTGKWGLKPDIWTAGKSIGGGVAAGVYGFHEKYAGQIQETLQHSGEGLVGIGGTFSGNSMSLNGIRLAMKHLFTPENYAAMEKSGAKLIQGLQSIFDTLELPWHAGPQLGARVTYHFFKTPAINMSQYIETALHEELTYYINLYLMNKGIMPMAFNNCLLTSPKTSDADCERVLTAFRDCLGELKAEGIL